MVRSPKGFPRKLSDEEQLEADIDKGLDSRKNSSEPQFLVTASRELLIKVIKKYDGVGWRVTFQHKKRMSANTARFMLKFSRK